MTKNSNPTGWRGTQIAWLACAFVLTSTFGISSIAKAESTSVTPLSPATARVTHTGTTPVGSPVGTTTEPDNTKANEKDKSSNAPTADQQKNNASDIEIAAQIRRAVVADKSLSTYAHNVKIIAQSGVVTLRGPVRSAAERATVEQKAVAVVGQANVKNELEVTP